MFFKTFDPDDPSTDDSLVDTNGPFGRDNRGNQAAPCAVVSASGGLSDVSGVAEIIFNVTSHPGDNFLAAASTNQQYLNDVCLGGTGFDLRDGSDNRLPTTQAQITRMLTVWRRLHIEVDSMASVSNNSLVGTILSVTPRRFGLTELRVSLDLKEDAFRNGRITVPGVVDHVVVQNGSQSVTINGSIQRDSVVGREFTLVDDDDFNSDDGPFSLNGDNGEDIGALAATFSFMKESDDPRENLFAAAYIRPVYDEAGVVNDSDEAPFLRNIANIRTVEDFDALLSPWRNSQPNESSDYWVVYVQLGYQPEVAKDLDPDSEKPLLGSTDFRSNTLVNEVLNACGVLRGANHSLLYLETIREYARLHGSARYLARVAPHEVGHQFGLQGDEPGFAIMSDHGDDAFDARHVNVLRWRVESPGQQLQGCGTVN